MINESSNDLESLRLNVIEMNESQETNNSKRAGAIDIKILA